MTMEDNLKYNKRIKGEGYRKYDNYDAIEIPHFSAIPSDYKGYMGVPISFLDKFCPEQFEIINPGICRKSATEELIAPGLDGWHIDKKRKFARIFIKHKEQP